MPAHTTFAQLADTHVVRDNVALIPVFPRYRSRASAKRNHPRSVSLFSSSLSKIRVRGEEILRLIAVSLEMCL